MLVVAVTAAEDGLVGVGPGLVDNLDEVEPVGLVATVLGRERRAGRGLQDLEVPAAVAGPCLRQRLVGGLDLHAQIGRARTGAPGIGDEPTCEQEQDHRRQDDEDDCER